jgi:thiamine biosynthesis lipoprotein
MGMPFTLEAPGEESGAAFDAAFAELRGLDRLLSPFIPESAVSRIAAGALRERDAGPLVAEVLDLCRIFEAETGGWFSAWASGQLDPCGLAKGWAIDRASRILADAGLRDHVVDGAGDVRVSGRRASGRPWRIGIRHPRRRRSVLGVIAASDLAVATSGTYEKGAHVLDPHSRRGATELVSVTVVGPDIVGADAYATAVQAAGVRGLGIVERARGYEALVVDRGLAARATAGFERYLTT